ncbi:MAG: metallophosphoesterase family protein [Balneolaceae bacterium]
MKMIAIGDIHGCCRSLEGLLEKLEEYPDHRLIFVGDYIDRGPCSREVVDCLIELEKKRDCVFLRGNHEQMLLDATGEGKHENFQMWIMNGGDNTLRSYGLTPAKLDFPADHLEFYRNTKFFYSTDDYFFVHAGAPIHQSLEASMENPQFRHDFLWTREHLNIYDTPWEKKVIFGHTPRPDPIQRPKMIGIDTGCVFSSPGYGKLTAVVLPDETFIQQESLDEQ